MNRALQIGMAQTIRSRNEATQTNFENLDETYCSQFELTPSKIFLPYVSF